VGFPWKRRGKLPRSFLFRKPKPFDYELQLPVIITAVFDKIFKHEFWTVLKLGPLLKKSLCPKGTGPFGIPRRGRGSSSNVVTAYRPDAPRPLYEKSVSIGLLYDVRPSGLEPKLLWRAGVGIQIHPVPSF